MKSKIKIIGVLFAIIIAISASVFDVPALTGQTENANVQTVPLSRAVFGALKTESNTPVIQLQFPYSIFSDQLLDIRENRGGLVTSELGMLTLTTGTQTESLAWLTSRESLQYRPGQGSSIMFTLLLPPCEPSFRALVGVGDIGDGFAVGCEGDSFVAARVSEGSAEVHRLTITGGATNTGSVRLTLDGDVLVVPLTAGDSRSEVALKISQADFGEAGLGWEPALVGIDIHIRSWSDEDKVGTFSFVDTGATGATATLIEGLAGATTQFEFFTPENFTHSSLPWLDITKINVYRIRYQWLGGGKIIWEVENPQTLEFETFHVINYTNKHTTLSVRNPNFPIGGMVMNSLTGTSSATIKIGSIGAFTEGTNIHASGIEHSTTGQTAVLSTTELPLITLYNKFVFGGRINRSRVTIGFLSFATESSKPVIFRVYKNAILGGVSNFQNHDPVNSTVDVDVASTSVVPGGKLLLSTILQKAGDKDLDLHNLGFKVNPGETFTITSQATGSTNNEALASITWREEF